MALQHDAFAGLEVRLVDRDGRTVFPTADGGCQFVLEVVDSGCYWVGGLDPQGVTPDAVCEALCKALAEFAQHWQEKGGKA